MSHIIIRWIEWYQRTLSPDHSPFFSRFHPIGFCRYYPSCSEYTKQSIHQYGFFRGSVRGVSRIFRCNPFSSGGVDMPSKTQQCHHTL